MGTAYNVCSMEDIEISRLLCWQWKYVVQNIIHLYFKTELWHLYKSLLPSAKGLSIYFYVESSSFLLKSTRWAPLSFVCITINLYWVWLWLDLFYHELQCLVSPWSLKVLCIYVLQSQKGLARYHFFISCYDCFEKVLSSEFYYYVSLADYAIDMSNCETYVSLWVWLVHDICWNLNAGFSCLQQQEQTEFVNVFLFLFQFVNWIAWGQERV